MSHTPNQDKPTRAVSAIIGSIPPPRWVHPASDPSVPKRLCFYKSGDYTFGGHRLIVSPRTFKTFDALLDALSKKVPLPFGVRTITTPRGVHVVKGLDDLHDGGSYLCSDRRRVKPLNLEEVNRRQVPWKTARALSAGRRRRRGLRLGSSVRGGDSGGRAAKVQERVAVRTPRRLVVVKNKDPAVRRTIVLQKRTAPTYDALLDYLSQILQFPVLKLYSVDGRRIGGLAALILCSGFLVAAGNEPFRLNNDNFHRASQTVQAPLMEAGQPSMLQLQQRNHKSLSRNFSLSSEQYMINQINNSRRGTANDPASSLQLNPACLDTRGTLTAAVQRDASVLPRDDDIEKSFRVNRDGSVTVEMKVRLTVKEQEMLHWTTTVSRSSLRTRSICASGLGSGKISPDSNIYVANGPSGTCKEEADQPRAIGEAIDVTTNKEAKPQIRRVPTPGPRRVKKAESVESLRMLTDSGAREGTVGHYSYLERMPQGETMEGYCRVRHSNSSQRVPKPGKTLPGGNNTSLLKSSGVVEVLKIENDGIQIRETVMRIYESRGSYDNYVANGGVDCSSLSSSPPGSQSSPSNDVDFSWQRPAADSIQGQKEEMLSLSSEPVPRTHRLANGPSLASTNAVEMGKNFTQLQTETQKTSRSRLMDQEQKRSTVGKRNNNDHHGNKNPGSTESSKSTPKPVEKTHKTTSSRHGKEPQTLVRISTRERNLNKLVATYNGHNVNSSFVRPSMKKNVSDLLRLKKPSRNKTGGKSTTLKDTTLTSSELAQRCISKLSFNRSPIEIHQYVENWLKGIIPDPVVYMVTTDAPQPPAKVLFQIGCDSETEENNETKTDPEGFCQTRSDPPRSSSSCPSVPIWFQENKPTDDPSPALEPTHQRNCVSSNISGVSKNESASSPVDILNLKERMKPLLWEICTFVRSLPITLDQSSSCLDFPSQVALVFGSSCTAFVSFLAAMVLGDCAMDKSAGSDADSEAMIFLRFLQNISAIQDLDEQRASLIALRSGASQRLIERWTDFQTFRATLATESLMLNFQDTQDLAGFHGCIANDLMRDLHMPGELRMEISSGFAQFLREDLQGHSSESANQEPVIQETELKQSCDRVSIPEEPNDEDCGSLRASEREDDSEQGIGKAEKSEEAMDEGTRRREVSEEDSEEESVEKVEELGLVRSESKENEQKDRLKVEEPGDEAMDDGPEEVRRDSAEKGVVDEVEGADEENIAEDVQVESVDDTAGEYCEHDDFQCERDEKHSIDKDMEEVMEALVEDNVERNIDLTEATIDEGRVSVIQWPEKMEEKEEGHGELSTEEESVKNVSGEAENEDDLRCSSEENSEEESVENVTDKKEGGKEEDEGREKEDIDKSQEEEIQVSSEDNPEEEHADEAAGDMEQGDPTEPTEEMNDASSEKESVEEPEKANQTSTEGETEGDGADDLNGRPSQEANSDVEAPETFRTGPERESGEEHQSNQKHSSESPKENLSDERFEEDLTHQNQAGINRQEHGDLSHPVEISQELLDFVNSALRSSSLKCTYDGQGNLRIESEHVQTPPETKKKLDPESPCPDKHLRSPITSDLSDYRPESLESADHQSRESTDLSSESSGEVSENPPGDLMSLDSNASQISKSSSAGESISSSDSPTKALREVLSSCRRQAPPPEEEQNSQMSDGVLIDQGRWLLKENHLIRNSPPISEGMYRDSDDSSSDGSSSGDSSEESLAIQDNPLAAISSSELEDLARPQPPRCSYFSMPHGSDSDPFPDDASAKSGRKDGHYAKGKGARVSPATAAADAWDDKNGSLSSFASVEFKIAGGKVHPEGRGSSGAPEVGVQSQDSSDVVHVRCGEYCQIL